MPLPGFARFAPPEEQRQLEAGSFEREARSAPPSTYPERRDDGSVWEITYDPITDTVLGERMVSGPAMPEETQGYGPEFESPGPTYDPFAAAVRARQAEPSPFEQALQSVGRGFEAQVGAYAQGIRDIPQNVLAMQQNPITRNLPFGLGPALGVMSAIPTLEPGLEAAGIPEGPGVDTPFGRLTARGVAGAIVDPTNLIPLGKVASVAPDVVKPLLKAADSAPTFYHGTQAGRFAPEQIAPQAGEPIFLSKQRGVAQAMGGPQVYEYTIAPEAKVLDLTPQGEAEAIKFLSELNTEPTMLENLKTLGFDVIHATPNETMVVNPAVLRPRTGGRLGQLATEEAGFLRFGGKEPTPDELLTLIDERAHAAFIQKYGKEPVLEGREAPYTYELMRQLRQEEFKKIEGGPLGQVIQRIKQLFPKAEEGFLRLEPGDIGPPTPSSGVRRGNVPPPAELTDPILKVAKSKEIVGAADDLFKAGGVTRDPNVLISDQILDFLQNERLALPEMEKILQRHNLSFSELGQQLFRPAVSDAARRLQVLSALERRLNALGRTSPEARAELERLSELHGGLEQAALMGTWRRMDNVRRGLMVTQLATTMRNLESGALRIGVDALDQALQAGLQRITGKTVTADPFIGLESLARLITPRTKTKAQVDAVLAAFPAQADRAFFNYSSDILSKGRAQGTGLGDKFLSGAENAVHVINALNRFQEFSTRRAVIASVLDRQLAKRGSSLEAVVQSGDMAALSLDDVRAAVDKALEMTFGRPGPQEGQFGHNLFKAMQNPAATALIPFPRFMVEALRFYNEFSPVGIIKAFTPAERAKMAAGDYKTLSRGVIGTGMLGTAYLLRESDLAGEKWYEFNTPDGRTIDLRAFAPFAPYLFAAEIIKQFRSGKLNWNKQLGGDILKTVTGLRAGVGSELIDRYVNDLLKLDFSTIGEAAGEYAAGPLTGLQTLNDIIGQIDQEHRIVRNRELEPFFGSLKERIPGVRTGLEPVYSPTSGAALERQETGLRQATGLTIGRAKNPAEKELDRLLFTRAEVLTNTGHQEWDRLMTQEMGPVVEAFISEIVAENEYKEQPDEVKALILREALGRVREAVRKALQKEYPETYKEMRIQSVPSREQRVLELEAVP